jgi:hypothetical protein
MGNMIRPRNSSGLEEFTSAMSHLTHMKSFFTVMTSILISSAALAQSQVVQTLSSLGLKNYTCVVSGHTQGRIPFAYSSSQSVFAKDKEEAIKLCLLKVDAILSRDESGPTLIATIKFLSEKPVLVEKIDILN